MDAIQVNAVLLRGLLPELRLTPGTALTGRILERHGAHGLLNLAGAVLVAELPEEVAEGARLRLAVQDVGAEKVVLRIVGEVPAGPAPQAPAPPPGALASPTVALPLPGGLEAHVRVETDAGGGAGAEGTKAVTVRYASPALGRIEVRLVLSASGLAAGVTAPPGAGVELAGEHAEELRTALRGVLGTAVDVHVGERRDRVDVRA